MHDVTETELKEVERLVLSGEPVRKEPEIVYVEKEVIKEVYVQFERAAGGSAAGVEEDLADSQLLKDI